MTGKQTNYTPLPYNKYMENPLVQMLSGFGKGIVQGVGLEVHPSLGSDTPLESGTSAVTKALFPGLNVPKAAVLTTKAATKTTLTEQEKQALVESYMGTASGLLPSNFPGKSLWDAYDTSQKAKDIGDAFLE